MALGFGRGRDRERDEREGERESERARERDSTKHKHWAMLGGCDQNLQRLPKAARERESRQTMRVPPPPPTARDSHKGS